MPKRIVILDPNGIEVASRQGVVDCKATERELWQKAVYEACNELSYLLKRENPKLGTYTVTIKEVE